MTNAQIDKLLAKYKKILRIEDWEITLNVMPDEEYQKVHGKDFAYDTNGCTEIHNDNSMATIYLKNSLSKEDTENTLLHECIHLVTHPYDSFVRETLKYVDSKRMGKKFQNDAMWAMEVQVSKFTTILRRLLK